jgi:hypothetical protein
LACRWFPQFYGRRIGSIIVVIEVSNRRIRGRVRTGIKLFLMSMEVARNELGGESLVVELGPDTGIAGIVDIVDEIAFSLMDLEIV